MNKQDIAAALAQTGYPIPLDVYYNIAASGVIVDEFIDNLDGYTDIDQLVDSMEDAYDLTEI